MHNDPHGNPYPAFTDDHGTPLPKPSGVRRIFNEPVLLAAVLNTGLLMLVQLGLNLSDTQIVSIMAFANALLAFAARALVTPNQLAEYRVSQGGSPTVPIKS